MTTDVSLAAARAAFYPPNSCIAGEYALATGAAAVTRLTLLHKICGPAGERLLMRAGLKPGMHVADFGCGIGSVTRTLARMVGEAGSVTGIDASANQLDQARRLSKKAEGFRNVTFHESDACTTG